MAKSHVPSGSCLQCEQVQNVLVVTPAGDAVGFGANQVKADTQAIEAYVRGNNSVTALVADLSANPYYGSQVIGALAHLGRLVRMRRGKVALVGASPEMWEVLKVMSLDTLSQRHKSRNEAVDSLAIHPAQLFFLRHRRAIVATFSFVIVGMLLWFVVPRLLSAVAEQSPAERALDQVAELQADFHRDLAAVPRRDVRAVIKFQNKYQQKAAEVATAIESEPFANSEAGTLMLKALRENFSEMVLTLAKSGDAASQAFDQTMRDARDALDE